MTAPWPSRLAILLIPLAPSAWSQGLSPSDVFRTASKSVTVVYSLDASGNSLRQGSGVVIGPETIVTNCHVTRGAIFVVIGYEDEEYYAAPLHMDVDRDICSFTAAGLPAPAARMKRSRPLQVGDHVYAIGAPRGLELTLSDGLLSALRQDTEGVLLQITAPISPGSSGGGLFDDQGRLVGITTWNITESQQLNFAHPVEWIESLPARHADPATRSASLEYAKVALNNLGDSLANTDPAYACKRPIVVARLKPELRNYHPVHYVNVFLADYDEVDRELCPSSNRPSWEAAVTTQLPPLETSTICTPARLRAGECRIPRQQ